MSRISKNNIGLSINGFTGVYGGEHTAGRPLYINSENSTSIKHETSWEINRSDPIILNSYKKNNFTFFGKDFSSNRYDYYRDQNDGKSYLSYDLNIDWYINDIDMDSDIAVVAVKDWTSTEKYVKNSVIYNGSIQNVGERRLTPVVYPINYFQNLKAYNAEIVYGGAVVGGGGGGGSSYGGGSVTFDATWDYYTYGPYGEILGPYSKTSSFSASLDCSTLLPETVTVPITCDLLATTPVISNMLETGLCGDAIINSTTVVSTDTNGLCPNDLCSTLSQSGAYQLNQGGDIYPPIYCYWQNGYNFGSPNASICSSSVSGIKMLPIKLSSDAVEFFISDEETFDLSDISFEVEFTPNVTGNISSNLYGAGLSSGNHIKTYEYGGIYSVNEFYNKLTNTGNLSHILSDDENKWYLVKREGVFTCNTLSDSPKTTRVDEIKDLDIYLSSYLLPTGSYINDLSLPIQISSTYHGTEYDEAGQPIVPHYELYPRNSIDTIVRNVSGYTLDIDSVKVNKYHNFFSCGKVDIYTKKYGNITDITNGVITSSGHGLSSSDIIKISCALPVESTVTELNGIHYVSGVSNDEFKLFHDPSFSYPVSTGNLKSITGVIWTAKTPTNWQYKTTLYSPMGKNGYGFEPKVRSVVETGIIEGSISGRAVSSSIYDGDYIKPQAHFDGKRSWTNFYPMERISKLTDTNDGIVYNGNKFGADVQIQQSGDIYIMMVTEPGAEVSFRIFDDFYIEDENSSNYPENKTVIPNYLPYGRVHFYTLGQDKNSEDWIQYVGTASVGSGTNPWKAYETLNLSYKRGEVTSPTPVKTYENYPININDVISSYNLTANNYWLGSRFYAWNKDMTYNQSINFYLPDQTMHQNQFGFLDYFGKSAAFDIESGVIHCVASTNSKYAGFTNASGLANVFCQSSAFNVNLADSGIAGYSGIVNRSTFVTVNYEQQWNEIEKYAYNIDFDDSKLIIGWPASYRGGEYLFIYDREGSGYISRQTITSNGNYGFGDYFVADNKYIVTDKKTNGLSYLQIYKLDHIFNQYYLYQTVSPTVDISDPKYINLSSDKYVMTNNLSYDNTTGNSATQTVSLYGRYDIYDNSLAFRDYNELVYMYNFGSGFQFVDHSFVVNPSEYTDIATIRMRPSNSTLTDNDLGGQFMEGMEIVQGSRFGLSANYNQLYTKTYVNPSYLSLVIKTIEGVVESSGTPLFTTVYETYATPYPSGFNFYISGPVQYNTSGNLFLKQIDPASGDVNLFIKQVDPFSSGTSLYIKDVMGRGSISLTISPIFENTLPITLKTYNYQSLENGTGNIIYYETLSTVTSSPNLYIESHYTGVPNVSGNLPMYILTDPYEDYAASMPFSIGRTNPPASSSASLNTFGFENTGTAFSSSSFYIAGPQFEKGTETSGTLNLVIKRIIEATTPLTVYNTYESGLLHGFIRGANVYSNSGVTLAISGISLPTVDNNSTNLRIKGTKL